MDNGSSNQENRILTDTNKKRTIQRWIRVLFFPAVFLAALILFPNNRAHPLFLEYLRTASNWPLAILIVSLVVCIRFFSSIDYKIRNLLVKTPAGYQIGSVPSQQTSDSLSNVNMETKEKDQVEKEKHLLQIIKFERFIRLTFRSQFKLLKFLENGKQLYDRVWFFYSEYLANSGNKDYPMVQYFNWLLKSAGFIELRNEDDKFYMLLTEEGRRFLSYCISMGYSEITFMPQ